MTSETRAQLGYPDDPITAPILIMQRAEIPAQSAVDIACEVIRRQCALPPGAVLDSSGQLVYHDRHEARTVRVRTATDDDRAALHVLRLLAWGAPGPHNPALPASDLQLLSRGLFSRAEFLAKESELYGLPISPSPPLPVSTSSAPAA